MNKNVAAVRLVERDEAAEAVELPEECACRSRRSRVWRVRACWR
jgi:hypothetical protein